MSDYLAAVAKLIDQNRDQPADTIVQKIVAMHFDALNRSNLEARVIELAKAGLTRASISAKTGYSQSGVYLILRRHGLTRKRKSPRKPLGAKEIRLVTRMLQAGTSFAEVARRVGYSRASLYRVPEVAALVRSRRPG